MFFPKTDFPTCALGLVSLFRVLSLLAVSDYECPLEPNCLSSDLTSVSFCVILAKLFNLSMPQFPHL